jgi:ADP-heptose:LPS heptosyltransferase
VSDAKKLLRRQRAHIVDWINEIEDFADTAALVASLDFVVCVGTSIAHLAGAMGKRVWLLDRHRSCWRWMRDHGDTPWYPGMRIFNQKERGDRDEVLTRALAELQQDAWRL